MNVKFSSYLITTLFCLLLMLSGCGEVGSSNGDNDTDIVSTEDEGKEDEGEVSEDKDDEGDGEGKVEEKGEDESEGEEDKDEVGGDDEESDWTFEDDNISFGISGVSPESILSDDGSVRLYVTDMGIRVYDSNDGLNFTEKTGSLPPGSDPTLIKLNNGTYRMYYVDNKTIKTATSSDGLNWNEESNTGISNTTGGQAWGVPDSIELLDGTIRLYWVDMPPGNSFEVIKSATASNGLDFTQESGYRTEDGYVDPYILLAEEGNWIGLFATTPAQSRLPQEIYIGTSTDGLTWSIGNEAIITVSGGNALDPTAVPLGDGSYRVYYSATPDSNPFSDFYLRSGILGRNE